MENDCISWWINALGYSGYDECLYWANQSIPVGHPYAAELSDILSPSGEIQARAVFSVEGVPTVCFLSGNERVSTGTKWLGQIREKIWNQNLLSLVLVLDDEKATLYPPSKEVQAGPEIIKDDATPDGLCSAADILSCDIQERYPNWFRLEDRVDRYLLKNLRLAVEGLQKTARLEKQPAQYLLGQLLFVCYLEDRGIISTTYQARRGVSSLKTLIAAKNREGLNHLLLNLRQDFNGDFLNVSSEGQPPWQSLNDEGFDVLGRFLLGEDLEIKQLRFWGYDFRYIPVELISGIYESFLGDEQKASGAYYTPRHLANLVIEEALRSTDPLKEIVYDGACGSGILLTTIFRRILGEAEARNGQQLTLKQRIALLTKHIYGSDINESACRITAFSLYLSLLERLIPSDIIELQEDQNTKLPNLIGTNLFMGIEQGDFFSPGNPLANSETKKFTLFLSNPPWREPEAGEWLSSDVWAEEAGTPRARRQMAGDFVFRSLDALCDDGRVCFILPLSLLLAPTSSNYVRGLIDRVCIERIINFGDLRKFLFPQAKHGCVVMLGAPRKAESIGRVGIDETFEYWIPKTDVSLAFQRLTLHSGDRHTLQAQAVQQDNSWLVAMFWGHEFDLALMSKLRNYGTFGDLTSGTGSRWSYRKGFHCKDRHIAQPVSSEKLQSMKFIDASALRGDCPVLTDMMLRPFPEEIKTVSRLPDDLLKVFSGPRIVFPDGASGNREIRAYFCNKPASFKSSVGVIAGDDADEDLLRFATAYLRSDLARYFLLMTAYQLLSERERITLLDIGRLPFILPEYHLHPMKAREIVAEVANRTRKLEEEPYFVTAENDACHVAIRNSLYEYFMLSDRERGIIDEVLNLVSPAIQPGGYDRIRTTLHREPTNKEIEEYGTFLVNELQSWQKALGGSGTFDIKISTSATERKGRFGVIAIEISREGTMHSTVVHPGALAGAIMTTLKDLNLLPQKLGSHFDYSTDVVVRSGDTVYIIKPLTMRLWLKHRALQDAKKLVMSIVAAAKSSSREPKYVQ